MTAPNWQVKPTENAWKVYPEGIPAWDNDEPENFFTTESDAVSAAIYRNREFDMLLFPSDAE